MIDHTDMSLKEVDPYGRRQTKMGQSHAVAKAEEKELILLGRIANTQTLFLPPTVRFFEPLLFISIIQGKSGQSGQEGKRREQMTEGKLRSEESESEKGGEVEEKRMFR